MKGLRPTLPASPCKFQPNHHPNPMNPIFHYSLRTVLSFLLLASASLGFSACSSHDVAKRQQTVTGWHQNMLDERGTRQQARDERFRASREAVLN